VRRWELTDEAEAEREGDVPVGTGYTPDAGDAGDTGNNGKAAGTADTADTGQTVDAVTAPDEDSFTLPDAWRSELRPRRGGLVAHTFFHSPDLDSWDRRLATAKARWGGDVTDPGGRLPGIDPHLAEAARRHLDGTADPVGAAVLAVLTDRGKLVYDPVAGAWHLRHGMVFAALATLELFSLHHEYDLRDERTVELSVRPEGAALQQSWLRRAAADYVRTRLCEAEESVYRETVAALAAHRRGPRRRILVSYLVPSETDWVAECCADPEAVTGEDPTLRAMLFESLNDARQLRDLLRAGAAAYDGRRSTVATVAEGVGPAAGELIAQAWRRPTTPAQGQWAQTQADLLARLPTDEAFGVLLAHAEEKWVRPALLEAAERYPVRAARLLAGRAASAPGRNPQLDQLLTAHVAAHRALLRSRLAQFPPEAAGVIRELLHPPVADAPADALPDLLVSPPWTRERTAPGPKTVRGLVAAPETRMEWGPGEREAWAAVAEEPERRWRRTHARPYPDVETLRQQFTQVDVFRLLDLFHGGPDTYRPLLAQWVPEDVWMLEEELKPVAARWEEDALPPLLHAAARQPAVAGGLLLPYRQLEVARLMADWFVRLKSAAPTARAWFARHGAGAAALLVPDAVGPAGPVRHRAEHALRALAATHGEDAVFDAAAGHGPEAVAAVRDLLSADGMELALPSRMPRPVAWAVPELLPRVLLRDRASALPAESVRHLLTMLAISRPGAVYTGVETVKEVCDPESLAAFAWSLFEQWRLSGMQPEENWALHALGWLGDDDTVRRLAPIVRNWPGEGAHQRAVQGLDVLTTLGSDTALLHLHDMAQRVKFKGLRARAQEKIEQVAAERGLSGEELADRLVPDFGLDADGSTVVDYGPRRFTVGFDEHLRPYVLDQGGKRRKDLPKPEAQDDAELAAAERKRFAALKKDVRTVASDRVRRLEDAMVTGRSWTAGEFHRLFVSHPLLGHLVRRLVWLRVPAGPPEGSPEETPQGRAAGGATAVTGAAAVTAFRVTEDRTFADVRDKEVTLPEDTHVRPAHPLHLGDELPAWTELFARRTLSQPFPQLTRPVHRLTDEEAARDTLERFQGVTVPNGALLGLERRGWTREEPMFAGVQLGLSKRVAENRWVVLGLSEGFVIGAVDATSEQTLEGMELYGPPGGPDPVREPSGPAFVELDPVTVSEVLTDLTELVTR
jgi:hypothetical protein